MVIIGQLMASVTMLWSSLATWRERERQKTYTTLIVCGKTFRFLHTVGKKRMYNLTKREWARNSHTR